jgi:adenylosuccinate synthase
MGGGAAVGGEATSQGPGDACDGGGLAGNAGPGLSPRTTPGPIKAAGGPAVGGTGGGASSGLAGNAGAGLSPLTTPGHIKGAGALGDFLREMGHEYGVTTGRPRRCGHLDLVALRYACVTNSLDSLVMTHLDVYDTLDEVSACVAYRIGSSTVEDFPASIEALNNACPVLHTFTGWKTSLADIRSYEDLPVQAREYIEFIERFCQTPVDVISVGCDRQATIIRKDAWTV